MTPPFSRLLLRGVMSTMSLRSQIIRLASANKALRPHLLPLLKAASREPTIPKGLKSGDHIEVHFLDEGERSHKLYTVVKVITPGKELRVKDENGRVSDFDIDYSVVSVEQIEVEDE